MGIFNKLLGDRKTKQGKAEAKKKMEDTLLSMQGIKEHAKYSGGYPVCPKCGFKFPMSKKDIDYQGGLNATMCPKCQTKMGL